MEKIRATLDGRLAAKGLEENETGLFITDVIRVVSGSPEQNLETIKRQLQLLGWREDYSDYGTVLLIQACYYDS
ncbi:MAG: hypothetical protein P9X24_19125 [Candidatus Hatepunaea meridiana]|nr:hypothetical protein [Candidatus Hatepunaea meridiana]